MRGYLLALVAVVLLALGGCQATVVERPYLLRSSFSDPQTFNYYLSTDSASRDALGVTLEGLTRLDPDTLEYVPNLAEGWEVFEAGTRYIFTLLPDLRWSDGEPLTAADVDFTFNQIIFNEAIATSSRDVMRIGEAGLLPEVRLLDERRLEFQLPEPFAPFLQIVGTPIMPQHLLAADLEPSEAGELPFLRRWGLDTDVQQVASLGPYQIQEYVPNQRLVYVPNPYYFRSDLPRIPRLVSQIVGSQDNQLVQFRSGSLDAYTVRGSDFQLLKQEEARGDFTIHNLGQTLDNSFFAFNLSQGRNPETDQPVVDPIKQAWFQDVRFRQAMAFAVNRQGLINSVLRGLGALQVSPFSPAHPFFLESGLPEYAYDPERALTLLTTAGFSRDADGLLRDRDGNRVRFTLNTNVGNNEREAMGALIKADLERIGVTVDFVPIEFSTLVNRLQTTRDWEAVMLSFGGGGTEPNSGANIWRSRGGLHIWNPQDLPGATLYPWEAEIDAIFSAGTKTLDFEARKALYDRFQIIVQEQLPLIGTVNPLLFEAIRDRLDGVDPRPILGSLWNLDELSLSGIDP